MRLLRRPAKMMQSHAIVFSVAVRISILIKNLAGGNGHSVIACQVPNTSRVGSEQKKNNFH